MTMPPMMDWSMYSTWLILVMPPLAAACLMLFCSPCDDQRPRMIVLWASPIFEPMGALVEIAAPLLIVAQLAMVSAAIATAANFMRFFFIELLILEG